MVTDSRVRGVGSHTRRSLESEWHVARTDAGAAGTPEQLQTLSLDWYAAMVPGTVAAALRDAGVWDWTHTENLDSSDWWYRCRFPAERAGTETRDVLRLCGLATIADVWLNGVHLLHSENMFVEQVADVSEALRDQNELLIRCASLSRALATRRPRGRWRTWLVEPQQLRWIRTTLLGRMPGWSASPQPVGPWRPVVLERRAQVHVVSADLRTQVHGTDGTVDLVLTVQAIGHGEITNAVCAVGETQSIMRLERRGDIVEIRGQVRLPDVQLWWPHTHGDQPLYPVTVRVGVGDASSDVDLGNVGFRTLQLDREQGTFALRVNDVPIFCRGACWSTVDVVRLAGSDEEYREALTLARDAGMNMIRIGGTMIYEADTFYDLCNELGILVWQDFMFSNMDYPIADEGFSATVRTEVTQLLHRLQGRPCLAVLCGNNEIEQQTAMLGLPREMWSNTLFQETLPAWCAELCPDVPYWPSSPSGGVFPFHVNAGDAHYFGHGPYLRAFDDVRTSGVRFASETLAFANVPEASTVALVPGGARGAGHHPGWKAGVPRDNGSGWDFEDVRDHYVEQLFGVRPAQIRYADPERYLALGRVASGEVIGRTIGAWRRPGSGCHGALIWFYRDLRPGAGWGLVDALGVPKAAYYYMRRACHPIAVVLSDDGLNGVHVDTMNDTAAPIDAQLRMTLYRHGAQRVATGTTDFVIPPRGSVDIAAEAVLEGGTFVDSSYAYRFGAPNHDLIVAVLTDRTTGVVLSDAYYLPLGFPAVLPLAPTLEAIATRLDDGTYRLEVSSASFSVAVSVEAEGFCPDDNYFHVEPGGRRTVGLRPLAGVRNASALTGTVTPLNAHHSTRIVVR
ncbi:MAG TPA: hypothetical protein VNU46_08200 [Gemmatimonadaceae bacterium]|jgi:beta-mannosidase|nr:hypothetical protein [Gemmatimonadaceae bacterium]